MLGKLALTVVIGLGLMGIVFVFFPPPNASHEILDSVEVKVILLEDKLDQLQRRADQLDKIYKIPLEPNK